MPTTTDIEEDVTFVIADAQRTVTVVIAKFGKVDTPIIADLNIVMQDPPYP